MAIDRQTSGQRNFKSTLQCKEDVWRWLKEEEQQRKEENQRKRKEQANEEQSESENLSSNNVTVLSS